MKNSKLAKEVVAHEKAEIKGCKKATSLDKKLLKKAKSSLSKKARKNA